VNRKHIFPLALALVAVAVLLAALITWIFPVNAGGAIARAKQASLVEPAARADSWGQLIEEYEDTVGAAGTWQVTRPASRGDYLWEVNYHPRGIAQTLWFGVRTRLGGVAMDENSATVREAMEAAIAVAGNR
jgi:hypothetical protein